MSEAADLRLTQPILAVFRPTRTDIALYVPGPSGTAACAIDLDEARQLHATLGQALALADAPGELIDQDTISGGTFPPGTAAEGGSLDDARDERNRDGPPDFSAASWESR